MNIYVCIEDFFFVSETIGPNLDTYQNAKVTYSLLPWKVSNQHVSSYISINSETGNLHAIRSLDYE